MRILKKCRRSRRGAQGTCDQPLKFYVPYQCQRVFSSDSENPSSGQPHGLFSPAQAETGDHRIKAGGWVQVGRGPAHRPCEEPRKRQSTLEGTDPKGGETRRGHQALVYPRAQGPPGIYSGVCLRRCKQTSPGRMGPAPGREAPSNKTLSHHPELGLRSKPLDQKQNVVLER